MATAALTVSARSVMDPDAINFRHGMYGTCINGQAFQIDPIVTHAGWQYAAYFNGPGHPCVARRRLPDGPWQRIVFTEHRINHSDAHNVAVVGVCAADGTIHLTYDHHGHPLRYRVSRPGAATKPEAANWDRGLFGPATSELVPGKVVDRVTYPALFPTPDGKLQFYYRVGGSGDGDSHLAEYDGATRAWTLLGPIVSRKGDFKRFHSRCAYHNGFHYGPGGRLHTTWVWREHYSSLLTNHDLMYGYSDDAGRTWHNSAGKRIGAAGSDPMHLDSPGVIVHPIPFDWGMMNNLTQNVDDAGRVHVVLWQNPPDAKGPTENWNDWRYFHYWRDADGGRWHQQRLPFAGRRPALLVAPGGDLLLVFTGGDDLRYRGHDTGGPLEIARASAASGWNDWAVVYHSAELFDGEPRADQTRWRDERVLSVYAQEHPAELGTPSPLRVLDFRP